MNQLMKQMPCFLANINSPFEKLGKEQVTLIFTNQIATN
jgi:hypothetical protein